MFTPEWVKVVAVENAVEVERRLAIADRHERLGRDVCAHMMRELAGEVATATYNLITRES